MGIDFEKCDSCKEYRHPDNIVRVELEGLGSRSYCVETCFKDEIVYGDFIPMNYDYLVKIVGQKEKIYHDFYKAEKYIDKLPEEEDIKTFLIHENGEEKEIFPCDIVAELLLLLLNQNHEFWKPVKSYFKEEISKEKEKIDRATKRIKYYESQM